MKTTPEAHVVRDSIDPTTGVRLTTVQATMHRFVLAELNTHRAFCLSGESEVWAEAPNGTSRKYQLSYLYDRWHNGAAPRASKKGKGWPTAVLVADRTYTVNEVVELLGMASSSTLNKYCRDGRVVAAEKNPNGQWSAPGAAWAESLAPTTNRQPMRDRLASIAIRQVSEEDLEPSLTRITDVIYSGEKETFTVKMGSRSIRASIDHLFLTPDGWRRLGDLAAGSKVAVALRGKPEQIRFTDRYKKIDGRWVSQWVRSAKHLLPARCECGENATEAHHEIPVHVDTSRAFDIGNLAHLCKKCHRGRHRKQGWQEGVPSYYDFKSIDSIEAHGLEHTFDLSVAGDSPNFVANGFVVHNSRNSASSRAIPVKKQLARVQTDTAMPVEFGVNKPGMQASEALSGHELAAARYAWIKAKDATVEESRRLSEELGVHKQVANRILEPWMWHTVIISSTEWNNFFSQRCSPLAQPEIRVVAELIREAREGSTPMELHEGEWHTPYIQPDEEALDLEVRKKVSAARCARVSYLTQEGTRDINEDLNLFERLAGANPPHHSPMEHVATPYPENFATYISEKNNGWVDRVEVPVIGNFLKYLQLRHALNNSRLPTEGQR